MEDLEVYSLEFRMFNEGSINEGLITKEIFSDKEKAEKLRQKMENGLKKTKARVRIIWESPEKKEEF